MNSYKCYKHTEILKLILNQIKPVDFKKLAGFKDEKSNLSLKHYLVSTVEEIVRIATANGWGLCTNNGRMYLYNGEYWDVIDADELKKFLSTAAEKMGVEKFEAKVYLFVDQLMKQFISATYLAKPKLPAGIILMNLDNGTIELGPHGLKTRPPKAADFLTYKLPFKHDDTATAPIFLSYLNRVLPDLDSQNILAEYLAYLFIKTSELKLEKVLLLYGNGANGKSVFFEVVNALLGGTKNVSNYSLQNLTNENGYARAMIANKLVNYASEINGKLESSIFKQLASGEPVEARLPFTNPFSIEDYAKLIFNCNVLPKDVEQTHAYFRRFLIIGFDVTIPENEQDKELAKKIINAELSGVFNWVLDGLSRLIYYKNFTVSKAVNKKLADYQKESDSVLTFLEEENYQKSIKNFTLLKDIYHEYKNYCNDHGNRPCSFKTVSARLKTAGFESERKSQGTVFYCEKVFNITSCAA
jgi:putative DNA primase/helicase